MDYSALLHFKNINLTSESPQISQTALDTRQSDINRSVPHRKFLMVLRSGVLVVSAHGKDKKGTKHVCHSNVSKLNSHKLAFFMTKKGPLEAKISKN